MIGFELNPSLMYRSISPYVPAIRYSRRVLPLAEGRKEVARRVLRETITLFQSRDQRHMPGVQ